MRKLDPENLIRLSKEKEEIQRKVDKIERQWKQMEKQIDMMNMKQAPMFAAENVFCPICKTYFSSSEYLGSVIDNEKTLWLANMVTHYRHYHIKSWNRCWNSNSGNRYRSGWFGDYEEEKRMVNERAKRQIIRKCREYLKHNNFLLSDVELLEMNSPETLNLAIKILHEQ